MKRSVFIAAAVAAFGAALGLGLYLANSTTSHVATSPPSAAPAGPRPKEVSVRNGTPAPIHYAIKANGSLAKPTIVDLPPGALERYPSPTAMILTYRRGDVEVTEALIPGNPYVFRPNEEDLPKLYGGSHMREDAEDLAPFIPTPFEVVDKMLEMASVGPEDVLYDLGCGDGRIVIAAAAKRGARGVGVDIDAERIGEAVAAARAANVQGRVRFRAEDAMKTDLAEATVVALYLLPETNLLLRPKLERELKPGAIVVSHNYRMGGWEGRRLSAAEIRDAEGTVHYVYVYRR